MEKGTKLKSVAEAEKLPLNLVQLDVTDESSVKGAISQIISKSGRIDVLVNNAGYGLGGAFEDSSIEEVRDQFDTNVFGIIRVTQEVLPHMRRQGFGRIVNISSAAGRIGHPGASIYVSSKFALEGLSEEVAYELEPFGIKVIVVEPGVIRTNFGNALVFAKKAQDPNSPYSQMMQKMSNNWTSMLQNGSPVELVSKAVVEAATAHAPEFRYVAGKDAEGWIQAKKSMSDAEFFGMIKQNLLR